MMPYPTMTGGCQIVVQLCSNLEKDLVNEKGMVDETSAQSINRNLGSYG
jgi:hypothetical protein